MEKIQIKNQSTLLGIDVGSTTIKVVLFKKGNLVYSTYERHYSMVRRKALEIVKRLKDEMEDEDIYIAISGSAGLGLVKENNIPFVQEVYATSELVKELAPQTNVVIELGGEDAKVIFFDKSGCDERMNGTCAGGTGAFIDQMATLLNVSLEEMDQLSLKSTRIYPIASRCGVFAKTDIQPLLNQGAKKEDVAASIFQAVCNQTIAGLAQGKRIKGNVLFLGGPLTYNLGLRKRFVETLHLKEECALFPSYGTISVALGTAFYASKQNKSFTYNEIIDLLEKAINAPLDISTTSPLFKDKEEYKEFVKRHEKDTVPSENIKNYQGDAYLGIDCGSTTTKLILIGENNQIIYTYYSSNKGNPISIVKEVLEDIYNNCADRITIKGSAVTGYGEELIVNAFHVDKGIVETMAHFKAAKHFNPNVDFIMDIGGQDMKCFKVKNNSIDSILLNEACSSGCGSFLETFAKSLGYSIQDFASLALFAKKPVNLGSRCTVFMNSSVKQAQKDGADIADISAGLSMSVIKNALYKVIRAHDASELGKEIVVQGGTFLNDAILRAFERELGCNVIRPNIAGLMGAFGAALYAKSLGLEKSSLINLDDLIKFTHKSTMTTCQGCTNHCHLTINTFNGKDRFISGNQCEKGSGIYSSSQKKPLPNLYEYKRSKLAELMQEDKEEGKFTIGIPLALGMYELAPFFVTLFSKLGFRVILSPFSSKPLYQKGQYSIPSDTVCYPAKLMHGHISTLIEKKVDAIFYPCLTYNVDEKMAINHYNCPVVAYYSELLKGNMEELEKVKFLYPYLNINSQKELTKEMIKVFKDIGFSFSKKEMGSAIAHANAKYVSWMNDIRNKGEQILEEASRDSTKRVMILSGRPYHIDPEINHGIDKLANSLGFIVVSEDAVPLQKEKLKINVLNQWTYHSRLYNAAYYATKHKNVDLVQLVSFGCGIDAITTDEIKDILESKNKLYTQIKIDEITNLGAVKIRLRSLLGALEERGE